MKNIDYSKYSAGELEAMLGQIDQADAIAPEPTVGDKVLHGAKEYLGRPIGRAARSVAGVVGDFSDLVASPLALVGLKPRSGEMLRENIDFLTGDYLKPRNKTEEYTDTATELVSGLPMGGPIPKVSKAILTGGQKAARLVQNVLSSQHPTISNLSGAAAAGATGKYVSEENPLDLENPLAKGAVGLGSSMLAGSVPAMSVAAAKGIKNIPSNAATKAAAFGDLDPAAVEHARESGIDILPADALRSKWAKRTQNGMASLPFIGGKIQKAMEKRYEQSLEALRQSNPGKLSKEAGADLVLAGSKANYAHHNEQFNKEYSDIGKEISVHEKKSEVGRSHLKEQYSIADQEILDKIKKLESSKSSTFSYSPKETADIDRQLLALKEQHSYIKQGMNNVSNPHLISPENSLSYLESLRNKFKTETMRNNFDASPIGQRRKQLMQMASENDGFVPYADMVEFRRIVDGSIDSFGIHGKISSGERKRLRGLVNKDVGQSLNKIDPSLEVAWKDVNQRHSEYVDKVLPAINKVLKNEKNGTDLGGLMSVLPDKKNGGKALKNILDHLPTTEEKQQLFDIVIRTAGTDNKGNFSMVKAYNYFNNLTPITQNRLLAASGKTAKEIKQYKSTMETINNVWKTSQEENFSGSSKHFIQHSITASVMYNIGSGNWASAAAQIGALGLGTAATGTALKNNRLVNAMYNGYQKENMTKKEFYNWCGKVSKADPHFRDVINNVIKPSAINAAKLNVAKEITARPVSYEAPELPQDVAPTQDAPIDYSQYSIEELEDMQHQISEGQ